MKEDPLVQELERTARLGLRKEGRGCILLMHNLDGMTQMMYCPLSKMADDPMPGVGDSPEFMNALGMYDTVNEYMVAEYIAETNGTTVPMWYRLLYKDAKLASSA